MCYTVISQTLRRHVGKNLNTQTIEKIDADKTRAYVICYTMISQTLRKHIGKNLFNSCISN